MSKKPHDTPMLDQLESGPWPSFVTGLKRLAKDNDYMTDLMGQLEHSYKTRKGYWKGGTVGVFGYGGGVIPRFSEVAEMFPASKEFHTLRVQPPAGMHYNTDVLRKMCDIWERHGSGLIAFHGQSGDIMFQGASTANVQGAWSALGSITDVKVTDFGSVLNTRPDVTQAYRWLLYTSPSQRDRTRSRMPSSA